MTIGYACIALGISSASMRSCILKNATPENLTQITTTNLSTLSRLLDYNHSRGIRLFRISSDLIPFGSHPINQQSWWEQEKNTLDALGEQIRTKDIRVSMHPGQYTVLNSSNPEIVSNSLKDIEYHCHVLDHMALSPAHKIIIHLGGVYGNKSLAAQRFVEHYKELSPAARKRLIIENDERFSIADVLEVADCLDIPVVFDVFHHQVHPPVQLQSIQTWMHLCRQTWKVTDGPQKIHYAEQAPGKRPGSHSQTVHIARFLEFYHHLETPLPDIMLEVKDKDLSAIKCINVLNKNLSIRSLEEEWARYKYMVLEHSPQGYTQIRNLLQEKKKLDPIAFYQLLEEALETLASPSTQRNALQHVWGYFKNQSSAKEKANWEQRLMRFEAGEASLHSLKAALYRLSVKYQQDYLLQSYYFLDRER